MSIHDGLDQANHYEKSQYFQAGRYIACIKAVKEIKGRNGEHVAIETQVVCVASDHPGAPRAGESAAQVFGIDGSKAETGQGNWFGFLLGVSGYKKEQLTAEQWRTVSLNACASPSAVAGTYMLLECHMIETKAGNPFTVHNWKNEATLADWHSFGVSPPEGVVPPG